MDEQTEPTPDMLNMAHIVLFTSSKAARCFMNPEQLFLPFTSYYKKVRNIEVEIKSVGRQSMLRIKAFL